MKSIKEPTAGILETWTREQPKTSDILRKYGVDYIHLVRVYTGIEFYNQYAHMSGFKHNWLIKLWSRLNHL